VNIVTDSGQEKFADILERAAISYQSQDLQIDLPDTRSVVNALLTAEKTVKQTKHAIDFADLAGEWRLCFSSGVKRAKKGKGITLDKGYYLPKFIPAFISISPNLADPSKGTIANQISLGGLRLKFTGVCRYPGKKNLLIFDFTDLEIYMFGRKIYQTKIRSGKTPDVNFSEIPIGKLPFFSFFWASSTSIAARGKGGGVALWVSAGNRE
jgi:hypothetical protein